MLGINKQLGFKPYIAASAWQVPVETLRAYLNAVVTTKVTRYHDP